MLKTISKYAHVARLVFALSLMLPLAAAVPADAKPSGSSSFKSGFSSQRSSSSSSFKSSGGAAKKSGGGFGSFGGSKAADSGKSDSALSRKLDRERSEANALRTLDERRAAQAAKEARPAPGYNQPAGGYADDRRAPPPQGYGYGSAPAPAQPPVIINNNGGGGLGHIVAGAILARSAANAHANGNNNGNNGSNGNNNGGYYPAPSGSAGDLANQAGAGSVGAGAGAAAVAPAPAAQKSGGSVLGTLFTLAVLALIGWGVYRVWKRAKARREANKPNYSFERN
jgi:hypothetical protein